jgi:SecD/SecF fusion protein
MPTESTEGNEQVFEAIDVDRWRSLQNCAIGATAILGIACVAALAVLGSLGPPVMDIDLGGGTRLVYAIADESPTPSNHTMHALIQALTRRAHQNRTKDVRIQVHNARQVEIMVAEVDVVEVEFIKNLMGTAGMLQFRIIANQRDHSGIIELAKEMAGDPDRKRAAIVRDGSNQEVGLWARVAREETMNGVDGPFKLLVSSNDLVRNASTGDLIDWTKWPTSTAAGFDDELANLQKFLEQEQVSEIDILVATDDGYDVTGNDLAMVSQGMDEFLNPCLNFSLAGSGIDRFADLTADNVPENDGFQRQLGILLDNHVLSAPNIQSTINRSGRITGKFTREEVSFMVNILQGGTLPVLLDREPLKVETFPADPTALHTMQTVLWSGLVVLLLALVTLTIRWRCLGTAAALAGFAQFLFPVALLLMIKLSFSVSLVAFLVCVAIAVLALNGLVCELAQRAHGSGQHQAEKASVRFLIPIAIFVFLCLVCCGVGAPIYAVGGPAVQRCAIVVMACSLSAILIHVCLWTLPALSALTGREARQLPSPLETES